MLKIKYKMHKFVNLIFYFIVWLSGFLVGYGTKGVLTYERIKESFTNWFI